MKKKNENVIVFDYDEAGLNFNIKFNIYEIEKKIGLLMDDVLKQPLFTEYIESIDMELIISENKDFDFDESFYIKVTSKNLNIFTDNNYAKELNEEITDNYEDVSIYLTRNNEENKYNKENIKIELSYDNFKFFEKEYVIYINGEIFEVK